MNGSGGSVPKSYPKADAGIRLPDGMGRNEEFSCRGSMTCYGTPQGTGASGMNYRLKNTLWCGSN